MISVLTYSPFTNVQVPLNFLMFLLIYEYECFAFTHVCEPHTCRSGAHRKQKRALDPSLKLQTVDPRYSGRIVNALNH